MILNTKKRDIRSRLLPLVLSAGIILLDQAAKLLVIATIPRGGGIKVIGDFFRIIHVQNPAIAFSIGHAIAAGPRRTLFIFLPLIVIALGLFILFRLAPNTPVHRAVVGRWQATLRATPYQDTLIIGVTFLSSSDASTNVADVVEAKVRMSLPGTGEQVLVAGMLEKSPMTLRADLPRVAGAKKVQAEVSIGNAKATLWVPAP